MTLGVRSAAACMILQEQRSVTVLAAGADWVVYQGWWRQRKPICSVGPWSHHARWGCCCGLYLCMGMIWWLVDKIAEAPAVLSVSGMKYAMHGQTSLAKRASRPPNPWLIVTRRCLAWMRPPPGC